jgi:hypothetical protein
MKIEKEVYDLFDAGAASVLVTCTVESTLPQDMQSVHQISINRILSDGKTIHGVLHKDKANLVEANDNFVEVRLRSVQDRWI